MNEPTPSSEKARPSGVSAVAPGPKRPTERNVVASCVDCDWERTTPNAQALAAKHHDFSGHEVQCILAVRYKRTGPMDGQIELPTELTQ